MKLAVLYKVDKNEPNNIELMKKELEGLDYHLFILFPCHKKYPSSERISTFDINYIIQVHQAHNYLLGHVSNDFTHIVRLNKNSPAGLRKIIDSYDFNKNGLTVNNDVAICNMEKLRKPPKQIIIDTKIKSDKTIMGHNLKAKQTPIHPPIIKTPMISVLIATYQCRELLPRALESLRNQTFKDFEVIIINDGGVDVGDIVKEYGLNYHYISLPINKNLPNALNEGLKIAKGKYYTRLDQDDEMLPNGLQDMLNGFINDDIYSVYANVRRDWYNGFEQRSFPGFDFLMNRNNALKENWLLPCSSMYRMDKLKATGEYDDKWSLVTDWEVALRMLYAYGITSWNYVNSNVAFVHVINTSASHVLEKEMISQKKKLVGYYKKAKYSFVETRAPKVLFYSAISDDYDTLNEIEFPLDNCDYICFTNNSNIESKTWKIIQIDDREDIKITGQLFARKIKLQIHKYYDVNDYKYIVWIDANIKIKKDVRPLITNIGNNQLSLVNHSNRKSLRECAEICAKYGKDKEDIIKKQIEKYDKENMPKDFGLWATHILIWKPTLGMFNFFDLWYKEVREYSVRDQISLPYVLWKTKISYNTILGMTLLDALWNKYFEWQGHQKQVVNE